MKFGSGMVELKRLRIAAEPVDYESGAVQPPQGQNKPREQTKKKIVLNGITVKCIYEFGYVTGHVSQGVTSFRSGLSPASLGKRENH